jgi:ABC-type polysaccharide/polyol phosphate transport system ATPase subunit
MSDNFNLQVVGVSKFYTHNNEQKKALNAVSFDLKNGAVLGLIGKNGCGKSTLLKVISGLVKPSCGKVVINGKLNSIIDIGHGFHPDLTGRENIEMIANLKNISEKNISELIDKVTLFSELEDAINIPIKHYSQGMFLRLAFSTSILTDFDILIIDEILSVGDEQFRLKCEDEIRKIVLQKKTIILASHDLNLVNRLCDKCILLNDGEVISSGETEKVIMAYKDSFLNHRFEPVNNDSLTINSIKINNKQINNTNIINVSEDFVMSFSYFKKSNKIPIVIHIDIYDENHHLLLNSSNIMGLNVGDLQQWQMGLEGELETQFTIPSYTLNEGNFFIIVNFSSYNYNPKEYSILYRSEEFSFQIVNKKNESIYWNQTPAPIRSKFVWKN